MKDFTKMKKLLQPALDIEAHAFTSEGRTNAMR